MDSQVSYQQSYQLTKKYGTSYFYATLLLDKKSRKHIYALYALCRYADDLVDVSNGQPGMSDTAKQDLEKFKQNVIEGITRGDVKDDLIGSISLTWNELDLPISYLERFFSSMEMDLSVSSYETFDDLLVYMDGSAAVIGEMVLPVLEPNKEKQVELFEGARALGNAFQLTNFLRDVGEDKARGRIYLPLKDFAEFGVDPHDLKYSDGFIELMKFEIKRNLDLYSNAYRSTIALKGRKGACVRTAFKLYSSILEEIENNNFDTLTKRARVSNSTKYAAALRELLRVRNETFIPSWISID